MDCQLPQGIGGSAGNKDVLFSRAPFPPACRCFLAASGVPCGRLLEVPLGVFPERPRWVRPRCF
eukprot:10992452-Alexandrium_andersonii.AAC.1